MGQKLFLIINIETSTVVSKPLDTLEEAKKLWESLLNRNLVIVETVFG